MPAYFVQNCRLDPAPSNQLWAANGTEITVNGRISLPIIINQRRYPSNFLVSENVDEVILGRNWLTNHKTVWDFSSDQLTINGHAVKLKRKETAPYCRRCRVGTDVQIPPNSEAVVPANLIFGHFRRPSSHEEWATAPSEPIPGLRVARTLVPNNSPAAAVRVCNISRKPITLRKGQSLSILQNVKVGSATIATSTNRDDARQQRRSIVEQIDPAVPQETRSQLSQLIENYQDVFSYSEFDLGSTDVVQHEIHTESNRPFKQALRPQPHARLPAIDNLLTEMQSQGIIEPCQSEWASNIVLVTKKDQILC